MEAHDAFRLRRETFGKPCMHEAIEKEYEQGVETEEWACSMCGTEFVSQKVWAKIRQNLQKSTVSQ